MKEGEHWNQVWHQVGRGGETHTHKACERKVKIIDRIIPDDRQWIEFGAQVRYWQSQNKKIKIKKFT